MAPAGPDKIISRAVILGVYSPDLNSYIPTRCRRRRALWPPPSDGSQRAGFPQPKALKPRFTISIVNALISASSRVVRRANRSADCVCAVSARVLLFDIVELEGIRGRRVMSFLRSGFGVLALGPFGRSRIRRIWLLFLLGFRLLGWGLR